MMNRVTRAPADAGGASTQVHRFPVRVYYEDTDAFAVVFYANYLRYVERARTEMLRAVGHESGALMRERGLAFAVHHLSADYHRPARLDELLEVRTRVLTVGGASLHLKQDVYREDDAIFEMDIRLVCMSLEGKAVRLPNDVRAALMTFSDSKEST